jgi:hypothetical protein
MQAFIVQRRDAAESALILFEYVLQWYWLNLHCVSIEEIQAESQQVLNTLTPADFNDCFQKWKNRWDSCIQVQGDYFDGDGGN